MRIPWSDGQHKRALELYNQGMSQTAVADKMGVTRSWLRLRFVERGVKLRRTWASKWRRCRGCEKVLTATKDNFYHKKDYLCKSCMVKRNRRINLEKLGLSERDFRQMLKNQGGVCAICHNEETAKNGKKLAIDHNHKTGEIRGLLCQACNTALGLLKENPEIFENAVRYLKK